MAKRGRVSALIKWSGRVGYKKTEEKLRKKKRVRSPKRLASWLKKEAKRRGWYKKKHKK